MVKHSLWHVFQDVIKLSASNVLEVCEGQLYLRKEVLPKKFSGRFSTYFFLMD